MWECKKCGSNNITRGISGKFTGVEYEFDKNGNSYDVEEVQLETTWSEEYQCCDCYEESMNINNIADWVE